MRTPNANCIICNKSLYRRPLELKKVKFVCCRNCRSKAYKKYPNELMISNLELGREKGTNHLEGIPKSKESNIKRSKSHKIWCSKNPNKVAERGLKTRGENHYQWKGGVTDLNKGIRLLTEQIKWQQKVKNRDKSCMICNSYEELESHHIVAVKTIIENNKLTNIGEARRCKELWNINNGIAVCAECHCKIHNRKYSKKGNGRRKNDNK